MTKEKTSGQGLWEYGENADKTVSIVSYWGEESDISVPDTIDGKKVSGIGDWAFSRGDSLLIDQRRKERNRIISIKLPKGIKYLGKYAFKGLNSLETVIMQSGLEYVGDHAFEDCENLKNVIFPDGVKYIGDRLFDGCDSLFFNEYENGLYLCRESNPFYMLCGIKDKDAYSFEICEKTEIVMSGAFLECRNLTEISFNGTCAVSLVCANAFSYCPLLARVSFSDKINEIREGQFYSCASLKRVDVYGKEIKKLRLSSRGGVENGLKAAINAPFLPPSVFTDDEKKNAVLGFAEAYENGGIYDEKIRREYLEYIKNNVSLFFPYLTQSAALLDIFISERLLDIEQTDGLLDDADLPSPSRASLIQYVKTNFSTIGFDLDFCLDFEDSGEKSQWEYDEYDGKITLKKYSGRAKEVVLPEQIDGNEVIAAATDLFDKNEEIFSVTLPKTLKTIENGAFRGLEGLKSITIPGSVNSIGAGAFENCVSLESATLECAVTRINDRVFAGCGLRTFKIPDGVVEIGHKAFDGCCNLCEIIIPDGVKRIPFDAFSGCDNLEKAVIPESVNGIYGLKSKKLTLYGKSGSYAEEYAKNNGMEFKEYER